MRKQEVAEEPEPTMNLSADKPTGLVVTRGAESIPIERSELRSSSLTRGATGPRTPAGKEKSKHNALKHGIFSNVVLLKNEPRSEFDSLLRGLRGDLQPEGTLEGILVEKLAALLWRYRRLIIAEGAGIQQDREFVEWDQRHQQAEEAEEIGTSSVFEDEPGLIRKTQNLDVLERCLELLAEVRQNIEDDGFNRERDTAVLAKIYGNRAERHLHESLSDTYVTWLETSEAPEEERQREGYASPEQCRKNVLQGICEEMRRLKRYQQTLMLINSGRTKLEILRRNIPDAAGMDRLLRYEASLERNFDRTLSQLERLQRMRLGQPVPAPIKVDHSVS